MYLYFVVPAKSCRSGRRLRGQDEISDLEALRLGSLAGHTHCARLGLAVLLKLAVMPALAYSLARHATLISALLSVPVIVVVVLLTG